MSLHTSAHVYVSFYYFLCYFLPVYMSSSYSLIKIVYNDSYAREWGLLGVLCCYLCRSVSVRTIFPINIYKIHFNL